ncbi:MAG: hypothetical protein QNJ16_00240 [Rhodobacter sp.]|nr:hypothetical protein [Rhodobacter sp.]
MTTALVILVLLAGGLVVAAVAAHTHAASIAHALHARLAGAPAPLDVSARLPRKVREFALRADATPDDLAVSVRFTQSAEMQLKPGRPWQALEARQTIATGTAGFIWQATQSLGPATKFRVIDSFVRGRGALRVWLFGLAPVVHANGGDIDRAEAMRYLAELPWAPDAILGNPDLAWRMDGEDWAEVSLAMPDEPVTVRFRFDAGGDIAEVFGPDRPTTDAEGNPVRYDWQGFFRDYRMIGPRRVPAEAEVGYVQPGGFLPYFQGRITAYEANH